MASPPRPRWLLPGATLVASCLLLGLSIAGWTWPAPPPPVTALTFVMARIWMVWLGLLALLLGLSTVLRRPELRLVAGSQLGLLGLVFLAVWGRAWWGPLAADPTDLVVMSWNVQRLGWDHADHDAKVDCVVAGVGAADPDLLVLLEVTAEDLEELAPRLGLSCEHTDYRGTGRADFGGLAACTRGEDWSLGLHAPRRFQTDEPWYYVFTEAVGPLGTLNLMAVHLQPYGVSKRTLVGEGPNPETTAANQQAAAQDLLVRVGKLEDPTLIAGDFNSGRDAALHVALRRTLQDAWEQGAWGGVSTVQAFDWLPLRIDYVYASQEFEVSRARVPSLDCSDHRPVVSGLRWR